MSALGFGPALALRSGAAAAGVGFDFTGGAMPAGATLTRGSAGTRINAAGVLVSEAAEVARFDYVPVTLAPGGLLVEPARSNGFTYAEQLDAAVWTASNATVTANDRVAPDGTGSADKLVLTSGGTMQRFGVGTGGAAISVSIWLYAAASVTGVKIGLYDEVAGGQYVTGPVPGGVWTRLSATRTFGAGSSDRRMQLLGPGAGATLWAWGAQGEAGATVTSYMPAASSGAAAGSRAADVLTLAFPGVADGAITLRVTFDDLSTQLLGMSVAGGVAVVAAAALNRGRVRRIERV